MDNLSPQNTCKHCGKTFSSVRARCGHTRIHFPPCVREPRAVVMVAQENAPRAGVMVAQESVPRAAVLLARENASPAAIFDLNETPDLMEEQENGGLPDLNVVPAVMVEAQGNGRVPDLNMLPEPEDDQV